MWQLYNIIRILIEIYRYALLIYIVMSWIPGSYQTKVGRWLTAICEPYLAPFRKIVPAFAGIDFSPIVAFIALYLVQSGIYYLFSFLF